MSANNLPRSEFPRPDFKRDSWIPLNGQWDFAFDKRKLETPDKVCFDEKITVPFCYESPMSGIGRWEDCETVWYRRQLTLTQEQLTGAVLLKFGAVDYEAHLWVNSTYIGTHKGGHTSFEFDIAHAATAGSNTVIVKAIDDLRTDKPRGKQSWKGEKFGCWYTPTSGIWQSVWVELTGKPHITQIKVTPNIDTLTADCEIYMSDTAAHRIEVEASFESRGQRIELGRIEAPIRNGCQRVTLTFADYDFLAAHVLFWTPDQPTLIDCAVTLKDGDTVRDRVDTYFGMRKISVSGDVVLLNNEPFFQRLVLDQGYWVESLLTPPSDEAIVKDITLAKEMGFNGARKHQKIEDPRYYYWADKLGFLVWGELPSSYCYNSAAVNNAQMELRDFILRDFNHPSIVTWVTINESWGVHNIQSNAQQQNFARSLYYTAKSLDSTRLVSSNDGWEQTEASDICALHDYAIFAENTDKYDRLPEVMRRGLPGRMSYAQGSCYQNKPILMTEYGGIAFSNTDRADWGYFGKVTNEAEFLARLEPVTDIFTKSRRFAGFCYTQLTDVMQEVNGLLDPQRQPKIPLEKLKAIFGKQWY